MQLNQQASASGLRVWGGAGVLVRGHTCVLADASVEFDLITRRFVADGVTSPQANSDINNLVRTFDHCGVKP